MHISADYCKKMLHKIWVLRGYPEESTAREVEQKLNTTQVFKTKYTYICGLVFVCSCKVQYVPAAYDPHLLHHIMQVVFHGIPKNELD